MDRRDFLATAGAGLAASLLPRAAHAAERQPNIVLMLSDDVGLGQLGCYGGAFATPHLDQLATGGIRFDRCYSTPLCGPTRCQLLTGRYPFRTGLITNQSHTAVSPEREKMIPTVLKAAGYATASVGKWGQICLGPREWGFDEHLVFKGSGRFWASQSPAYDVNGRERELGEREYLPDVMHDFAVDFVRRHRDRPFFLYYPLSHMHGPILPTPESRPNADPRQLYADNVVYMDKLVGKLVAELERLGLRGNTLVLFTGDNGTAHFDPGLVLGKPLSGKKGSMLEGGARVPLLANWPGTTPAGRVCDDLVDCSDFFATTAQLAGARLPAGVTLDSQSFAAQIKGAAGQPREWVYVELGGRSYVADKRWKLTNAGQLYDLSKAPFEELPVAADSKDPAAVAARARLQAVLATHPAKPVDAGTAAAVGQRRKARQGKNKQA
jgi:arylsulfatase A